MEVPRPKSPPGKRPRDLAQVMILETQIPSLQEELKWIETIQPVSCCIKDVADYVVTKPEPLIIEHRKTRKSCGGFWKLLLCCFNMRPVSCCNCKGCCSLPAACCSCSSSCGCSSASKMCCCCWPSKCWNPKSGCSCLQTKSCCYCQRCCC